MELGAAGQRGHAEQTFLPADEKCTGLDALLPNAYSERLF